MKSHRVLMGLAVAALLFVGVLAVRFFQTSSPAAPTATPILTDPVEVPQVREQTTVPDAPPVIEAPTENDDVCESELPLDRSNPIVAAEIDRLSDLMISGEYFESYRGVDFETVGEFARAGDTSAMMVMGATYELRVQQASSTADPIDLINSELGSELELTPSDKWSPKQIDDLDQAIYWYYQAALNGRLFALQNYGELLDKRFGGPVGLGWVTREQFEALSGSDEADALIPSNVFGLILFEIEPRLKQGLVGVMSESVTEDPAFLQASELSDAIRAEQREIFLRDREAAGLQAPVIPPAPYSNEELRRLLCADSSDP